MLMNQRTIAEATIQTSYNSTRLKFISFVDFSYNFRNSVVLPVYNTRTILMLRSPVLFLLLELHDFLTLPALIRLISQPCLDRFQPDLVTRAPDHAPTCHTTSLELKVMHRGQKGHQKGYSSYRLHDMVMWLIHMHQLHPFYKQGGK